MKTVSWPRTRKSSLGWYNLSAPSADTGARWAVVWDTVRQSGTDGRNTALEKRESDALERARHILRMGFVVYEIREPSGSVVLEEGEIKKRFGAQFAAPSRPPKAGPSPAAVAAMLPEFALLGRHIFQAG